MRQLPSSLIVGAAVGMLAGGAAALMSSQNSRRVRTIKKGTAKALRTITGMVNDVASMIR